MKYLYTLTVILVILNGEVVYAQNQQDRNATDTRDISGAIFGKTMENGQEVEYPTYGANVCLLSPKDSSIIKFTTSDDKGNFLIKTVATGDYLLSFSGLGYNKHFIAITKASFRKKSIEVGRIQLEESPIELSGVTITANSPQVVVKGDTLEYNPAAFRVQESSVVEELLKRLPGVVVDPDGKITVAGKVISKVYVDGKEFFGNDPKMATKHLTVNMIEKVQVIEKKSDLAQRTGIDDGERENVINLTIKKDMKKGWFGNLIAGTGAPVKDLDVQKKLYTANGMANRFRNNDQLSLLVHSNNIDGGGSSGANSRNTVGVNASKEVSSKLKLNGNIRYGYSERFSSGNSFRQNLLIDSVSYQRNMNWNQGYSHNFGFDTRAEYKPDSLNMLYFSGRLSRNTSNSHSVTSQSTMAGDADSSRVNASNADTYNLSSGWVLGLELTWSRQFAKKGRRMNFMASTNWNTNTTNGMNLSVNEFFLQPDRNMRLNQDANIGTHNNSYRFNASYIEPIGEGNSLQFTYNLQYNTTLNIRETYDYDQETGEYSLLNPDYSKSLDNNFATQNIGLSFNATRKKYSYSAGVTIVPSYTQSTNFIKNGRMDGADSVLNRIAGRNVVNYAPRANFRYQIDDNTNLNFNYHGNTRQPSVSELDPTPDNTNPLHIRTGNPDLLPAFSNGISFGLNRYQREKQRSFVVNGGFSFTLNEIISITEYEAETGIQHTRPLNENGSWSGSTNILCNLPLDKAKKLQLSVQSMVSYNNRIGYTVVDKRSERNTSGTAGVSGNIGLNYNKDWFFGQCRGGINYSNTVNSLEGKQGLESFHYSVTYNTQLQLPHNWVFNTDINYMASRGLSAGYNKDEVLWNLSVNKQFMKKKQASIILQWNDILQQRKNIFRNVTANYIEDSEQDLLTSYLMLTFSYRFNTMGRNAGQ